MQNEASLYARDLLRITLDLLDDDESLTAVAMIAGALDVLERKAEPVAMRTDVSWRHMAHHQVQMGHSRSCA